MVIKLFSTLTPNNNNNIQSSVCYYLHPQHVGLHLDWDQLLLTLHLNLETAQQSRGFMNLGYSDPAAP